jgi:hypothetical protein
MPPFIVRPKEKSEDPNDYSERNSTPRRPELTVLNLDVNPLKTEMISIKGHENHNAQSSHHSHDLTYQSFCKTHVSHGNVALSSIVETNSRGLDAFSGSCLFQPPRRRLRLAQPLRIGSTLRSGGKIPKGAPAALTATGACP